MKYVANNILNTRIVLNNKTNEEWVSSTYSSVIPLKGEICIYSDLRKIKIGDGVNTITDLTFANLTPEEVQSLIQAASHSHSNKTILDGTTASFTTELLEKLNDIATGAEVNQNAFSKITVGSTTIEADTKTDTLTFVSGNNITLTPDATGNSVTIASIDTDTHYTSHLYVGASGGNANATSATSNPYLLCVDNTTNRNSIQLKAGSNMSISAVNGVVTFTATDTTYSVATTSANGLMSSTDKTKLDGIATSANNYTHPTSAGNKHIPSGGSSGQILGYSASGTAAWTNSVSDLVVSGSLSMGRKADTTIGSNSFAFGSNVTASGKYSFAGGNQTTSSGNSSFAFGSGAKAEGDYSIALGYHTTAKATLPDSSATAIGYYTTANKYQFACGKYNSSATGGSVTSTSSGTAFVIGNGTASSNSNACRITYAGAVIGKAAYQSTGADFAELREWSDGNPNNEDRRGYFVTMDGMNIRIASPGDYICGIISANPSVIGNNDEDWMGRYVFDDFGAFVYEDYEETDPETGEVRTFTHYKENPEYDPTREYEFRADRPEWDYVGLCGVIHVRDDGTCQQNGFCKCAAGGIATASERGYRVLERVNDHIVKVLFYLTGETF